MRRGGKQTRTDSLSVFLNAHHRSRGAICLGDDVKRPAVEIVAAENPRVDFERLFIGTLVTLAKIPPVARSGDGGGFGADPLPPAVPQPLRRRRPPRGESAVP